MPTKMPNCYLVACAKTSNEKYHVRTITSISCHEKNTNSKSKS